MTFKYGLGDEFIEVLKTLHKLGLDSKERIAVKGVEVAPRDVVAAAPPDPATLSRGLPRQPFLAKLEEYGSPHGILELAP